MIHRPLVRTIVAAAVLITAGAVNAQVVQCISADAVTTFTDAPCKDAADTVRIVRASRSEPDGSQSQPSVRSLAEAGRVHSARAAMQHPSGRSLSGDVTMLKVARSMLTSNDAASNVTRKQARIDSDLARAASYWAWLVPMSAFSDAAQ
jgi:hypothetical protein